MSAVLEVLDDGTLRELRLNRPEANNALDTELKEALLAELTRAADDESVRAVVLTGAGRSFCVGQDLGELAGTLAQSPERASETVGLHYSPIARLLATMPKPVLAGVHGTCVGAGLGFALACDLQVWGSGITLGTAFSKVALTCDSGLSATLPAIVGAAKARELVLLAETFTPEQAQGWGFAGAIVDPADVREQALALGRRLAAGPTVALAASKQLLAAPTTLTDALVEEERLQALCGAHPDHLAGVRAFFTR